MSIAPVGSLYSVGSFGANQIDVTTTTIGDVLIMSTQMNYLGASIASVAGGNVTTWTRLGGPFNGYNDALELWWGTVSSVGTATIYTTVTGLPSDVSFSSIYSELNVQEFTAGLGPSTVWAVDTWAGRTNNTSTTTVLYPSLTPASSGELYFAHSVGNDTAVAGNTPGVTYASDAAGDMELWANPPAGTAFSPTSSYSKATKTSTIAALVKASGGTVTAQGKATLVGSGTLNATGQTAIGVGAVTLSGRGTLSGSFGVGQPPPPEEGSPPPPPPADGGPARAFPSAAGLALYNELGPLTAGDDALGYPLRTYVDTAAGQILQDLDDLVRDTPAGPGWSQAMDPDRAPTAALGWLGQFIGVLVDTSLSDPDQRTQIKTESGFARGTVGAIKAAAEKHLAAGQYATITERSGGNAYALKVTVNGAGVQRRDYADLAVSYPTYNALAAAFPTYADFAPASDQITAAINAVKPAGLVLTVILA